MGRMAALCQHTSVHLDHCAIITAQCKLLDCKTKAKNAQVLKPKLGKLANCSSVLVSSRRLGGPKSKMA
eukprot:3761342-Amphidinium_carterae.1